MSKHSTKLLRLAAALSTAVAALAATAAPPAGNAAAETKYQQDRAACAAGHTAEDRATCLKEAGAALAEARRGDLSGGNGQLRANATARCNVLSGDERTDCLARMNGQGTTSGSVAGGGILREKVTTIPAPAGGGAATK